MQIATALQLLSLSLAACWLEHWRLDGLEDTVVPIVTVDDGLVVGVTDCDGVAWIVLVIVTVTVVVISWVLAHVDSTGLLLMILFMVKDVTITLEEVTMVEAVESVFIIVVDSKGTEWSKAVQVIQSSKMCTLWHIAS